jgi:hypothetical protein
MDENYDEGFLLAMYRIPCCGSSLNLNQLEYFWPQAFGRYSLAAKNPRVSQLNTEVR